MDKNLQNIEDLFKKGLEGNEETPSENVWNNIDQSLEKENSLKFRKKYYSLKTATAILVMVVALLSIYILRNELQKQTEKQKNEKLGKENGVLKKEKPATNNLTETIKNHQPEKNFSLLRKEGKIKSTNGDANRSLLKRNNANESLKSSGENVSNEAAINKLIISPRPTEKKSSVVVNNPFLKKPQENHSNDFNSHNLVIQPPAINFEFAQIRSFNALKNLKHTTTISPYTMPKKPNSNRSTIHIPSTPQFYADVFYSPTIPFSHLRDDDHQSGNPSSREFEKKESGTYSYSFGFSIGYQFNHKCSMQSGISFSTLNMDHEPEKIYAERDNRGAVKFPINTSSGKGYILPSFTSNPRIGDSLDTKNIEHSLVYTVIPLAFKYNKTFGRLSANLLAGLSANILIKGKISTEVKSGNESELERTGEIHGLKPVYIAALAGIGFDYAIFKNLSLTFSPTINFAIDPINKNVPIRSYPGTIDFHSGVKIRF